MRIASKRAGIVLAAATAFVGPIAGVCDSDPPAVLIHRGAPPRSAASASATVTIPADTEVATELLSGIHTQVSRVGDSVTARLSRPLYINGRIALPLGTLLDGRITKIRPAGRLNRPAALALRFDRIALPDGEAEPVRGVLAALESSVKTRLDSEGYLKGAQGVSWKGVAGSIVVLSALAFARVPVGGSSVLGSILPAGGASALTYAFVWRRGSDVHLPPETLCRVRLTHPVTVRIPW